MADEKESFEGWAILELMGHRKLAGRVSEAVIGGQSFIRLDIPSEPPATQFYSGGALYCLTPTTEELARAFAKRAQPTPVSRWELPSETPRRDVEDAEEIPY